MTTTHVFIVNEQSIPVHLEYLFAGTGAAEADQHIGLLADITRVKPGDEVIFYLEANKNTDGGFFGIFKVADLSPVIIYDKNVPTYLESILGKKLIYRVRIEPTSIYAKGIAEYKALDNLPRYAKEVIWSLIYRKLKGIRGCTPITQEESARLIKLIEDENNQQKLNYTNNDGFTYNGITGQIEILKNKRQKYTGIIAPLPAILPEIFRLDNLGRAFESYLQTYFTQNAGSQQLAPITGNNNQIIWLGNEVKCGVGIRSIDIFTVLEHQRQVLEYRIIELKDEYVSPEITKQIFKYVNWTGQYIEGYTAPL